VPHTRFFVECGSAPHQAAVHRTAEAALPPTKSGLSFPRRLFLYPLGGALQSSRRPRQIRLSID
jgi:hypothetical protein